MKNENKTQSSPRYCRQPPLSKGAAGRVSRGEHGHPHAVGQDGWGGHRGAPWLWGGCSPTPPRRPRSPCCELCRHRPWRLGPGGPRCSRGSLGCSASPAAPLRGASTRVTPGGHGPLPAPPPNPGVYLSPPGNARGKKSRPQDIPLGRRPPASYLAGAERAAPREGLRMDGAVSAAKKPPCRWDLSGLAAEH